MEGRDFKFCSCVYNVVKQWPCNGNWPITDSLLIKCENVNFSVNWSRKILLNHWHLTCSVKTSCVNKCLILFMLFDLDNTFIPKVEQTRSIIAESWLLWKWMAMSNNISPKEAVTPLALEKDKHKISPINL